MSLIERASLLSALAPPLDRELASALITEFVSCERRFIQRDWEPATLDGGQFAEVCARVFYHQDSRTLNPTKGFDECCEWIEDPKNERQHAMSRRDALHVVRVLRTIYKFRSQRGAVHITPHYGPNEMDARLVIENVRWVMADVLRIFWSADRDAVACRVRELLQFDVPVIGKFEDVILVQRTDLSTEEELLLLLHFAGERGWTRTELGRHARRARSSVTTSLQRLSSAECREVVCVGDAYRLTDLGSKRVREHLAGKLLIAK